MTDLKNIQLKIVSVHSEHFLDRQFIIGISNGEKEVFTKFNGCEQAPQNI